MGQNDIKPFGLSKLGIEDRYFEKTEFVLFA